MAIVVVVSLVTILLLLVLLLALLLLAGKIKVLACLHQPSAENHNNSNTAGQQQRYLAECYTKCWG